MCGLYYQGRRQPLSSNISLNFRLGRKLNLLSWELHSLQLNDKMQNSRKDKSGLLIFQNIQSCYELQLWSLKWALLSHSILLFTVFLDTSRERHFPLSQMQWTSPSYWLQITQQCTVSWHIQYHWLAGYWPTSGYFCHGLRQDLCNYVIKYWTWLHYQCWSRQPWCCCV